MKSQRTCHEVSELALGAFSYWEGHPIWVQILDTLPNLQVYLAGGVIRDLVLGQLSDPKDFDLFIGGEGVDEALLMLDRQGRLVLGPFGSPRWFPTSNLTIYADVIPIERFHNGLWACRDIVDALNQFDFTGNAIAVDVRSGEWFDPQNGYRDLCERKLKAVRFDYPNEPIVQSGNLTRHEVLFFRFLHYAMQCELRIEPVTLAWLAGHQEFVSHKREFEASFFRLHPGTFDALKHAVEETRSNRKLYERESSINP